MFLSCRLKFVKILRLPSKINTIFGWANIETWSLKPRTLRLCLAKMKLSACTTCLLAFLAFAGLAMSAQMPNSLHGDTSEYLRLLAGIKSGNVTLTGQNVSAAIPWVYTSQGIKFQEKLKQGKMIIKFSLSRCQHINISKVKYSLFLIEGVCTK